MLRDYIVCMQQACCRKDTHENSPTINQYETNLWIRQRFLILIFKTSLNSRIMPLLMSFHIAEGRCEWALPLGPAHGQLQLGAVCESQNADQASRRQQRRSSADPHRPLHGSTSPDGASGPELCAAGGRMGNGEGGERGEGEAAHATRAPARQRPLVIRPRGGARPPHGSGTGLKGGSGGRAGKGDGQPGGTGRPRPGERPRSGSARVRLPRTRSRHDPRALGYRQRPGKRGALPHAIHPPDTAPGQPPRRTPLPAVRGTAQLRWRPRPLPPLPPAGRPRCACASPAPSPCSWVHPRASGQAAVAARPRQRPARALRKGWWGCGTASFVTSLWACACAVALVPLTRGRAGSRGRRCGSCAGAVGRWRSCDVAVTSLWRDCGVAVLCCAVAAAGCVRPPRHRGQRCCGGWRVTSRRSLPPVLVSARPRRRGRRAGRPRGGWPEPLRAPGPREGVCTLCFSPSGCRCHFSPEPGLAHLWVWGKGRRGRRGAEEGERCQAAHRERERQSASVVRVRWLL